MLYREACGDKLSRLAFGTMRLPQKEARSAAEKVGTVQRND